MAGRWSGVQERASGGDETYRYVRKDHEGGEARVMVSVCCPPKQKPCGVPTCQAKGRLLRFRSASKMARIFHGLVGKMRLNNAGMLVDSMMVICWYNCAGPGGRLSGFISP